MDHRAAVADPTPVDATAIREPGTEQVGSFAKLAGIDPLTDALVAA
jgi:hypothetical protein